MERDAITTAARAIRRCRPEPMYRGDLPGVVNAADRRVAEAVVDAVRPLIRRERDAELRRQIEALSHRSGYPVADSAVKQYREKVLALLGESTKDEE